MDTQSFDAIFENGSFRPVNPGDLTVRDGEQVRIRIEQSVGSTSLDLATRVYEGLTSAEIDEIERIALDRSKFFDGRELTQ